MENETRCSQIELQNLLKKVYEEEQRGNIGGVLDAIDESIKRCPELVQPMDEDLWKLGEELVKDVDIRGFDVDIKVLGLRHVVMNDTVKEINVPFIAISIQDGRDGEVPYPKNPNCKGVLHLAFDDFDKDRYEQFKKENEVDGYVPHYVPMTREQAAQVWDFVNKHLDEVELIVCQCVAGMSRSAGTAAAIGKVLHGEDDFFFKQYVPNRYVYRTLLEVWHEREANGN